jgi:hypothetical protein
MQIKLKSFPFYFTCFTLFLPILNHIVGIELGSAFIFIIFLFTLIRLKSSTRYPQYFLFFSLFWLIILGLHFFFKKNLSVFGYMQSFFYASCFYLILKNLKVKISANDIYKFLRVIYLIILLSLLVELGINLVGKESLLMYFFSGKEGIGLKNYQLLPSRVVAQITGLELNSLNSIFFGPQSASILALICLLFYNKFEKLYYRGSTLLTIISFGLLIYANTMTASLICIIFLSYFIFFSKFSRLNNSFYKFLLIFILVFFFTAFINIFFFVISDDVYLDFYLLTWFQPFFDLASLDIGKIIFGIPESAKIENFTISWEFGLIQMIYLVGMLPIIFWGTLSLYLVHLTFRFRKYVTKNNIIHLKIFYQLARSGLFVLLVSMFSLFHYLAIFSTGFFQFIGINLAILFYSIDQFSIHSKQDEPMLLDIAPIIYRQQKVLSL